MQTRKKSKACFFFKQIHEPFPKQNILDSSKLKEFADDYFNFDENDRKSFTLVENTVGKGKIAHFEQFSLFPFKRPILQTLKNQGFFGKGLKTLFVDSGINVTIYNNYV